MRKALAITFLSIGCILLFVPLAIMVQIFVLPDFILLFPLFLLASVLAYAAFNVKKLIKNNQKKDAGALIVIIMIMVIFALITVPLSFSIFRRVALCIPLMQ